MTATDVLISEDVWGEPFAALAEELTVRQDAALVTDRARLLSEVATARALVVRNRTQVDAELLAAAPQLRIVARAGVGLDNIDLPAADERGVVVVAPLGANAHSVAEHSIGLALDLARRTSAKDRQVRAGDWDRSPGIELAGRTWGVVGAGATGRAVAALARALGMSAIGYDPFLTSAQNLELVPLPELIARSDVLSLHVPATADTAGMVDAKFLAALRPGALLINVGRGELIVEADLAAALKNGGLGGAALDVRAVEPPQRGELETLDNVVLTPHIAGITVESQERIVSALAEELRAVLNGRPATRAVGKVTA
ncbi:MAG TPA: NAD(P)-dependent oxidoreductase [Mycobacteriales bacterium]|nr:NAD(P)-dependent oxidoreductase [Mycobacteriales bacterium]